jgi:hypothetical protein
LIKRDRQRAADQEGDQLHHAIFADRNGDVPWNFTTMSVEYSGAPPELLRERTARSSRTRHKKLRAAE